MSWMSWTRSISSTARMSRHIFFASMLRVRQMKKRVLVELASNRSTSASIWTTVALELVVVVIPAEGV